MHTATRAAVRTTQAARTSLSQALDVSFSSGTVMGLSVVGLGLFGVVFFTWIFGATSLGLSEALGFSTEHSHDPTDENYIGLDARSRDLVIELQKVTHPSRLHLDIEADDVEAEVRRLERLGAKRIAQVKTWWVMEAPSGHRFCVVEVQDPAYFALTANVWG